MLLFYSSALTLNLLTTTIVAPPSNASKWQMGFNSAFKGLNNVQILYTYVELLGYNLKISQESDVCNC